MKRSSKIQPPMSTVKITSIGVWSLTATATLYALIVGILFDVVAFVGWKAIENSGAITTLDEKIASVVGDDAFVLADILTTGRIMGIVLILTAAFVALVPLLTLTLGGIYSAVSTITGGVRINLTAATVAPELSPEPPVEPRIEPKGETL